MQQQIAVGKSAIIVLILALFLSACIKPLPMTTPPPTTVQPDIPSLYETLAPYFPIGAAIEPWQLDSDAHTVLLTRHFNSITAENVMKSDPIHPSEGEFHWTPADRLADFARENNLFVHGHALVWHQQAAEWMFRDTGNQPLTATPENRALVLQRLAAHIRAVVGRYKDVVNVWDVVNEVIDENQPDCLRRSRWYELTGKEYIETAFRVAHEVAPDAALLINDYSTTNPRKRQCIYDLVQGLQADGVPVDGVGMQMHTNIQSPTPQVVETTIRKFAELGQVHITEFDMSIYTNNTDKYESVPETVLARQGERYQALFDVFKRNSDLIASVTFWGMADDHTWLKTWPITRINLPLPFDAQLQPKDAFWGIVDSSKLPGQEE